MSPFTEHQVQSALVEWFRHRWPKVRIFAIPNGGLRSKRVANDLRWEGVSPGVPDLFVPAWRLWIEVKTEKGRLSPAQRDWIQYLESVGYRCLVVYGIDDAINQIVKTAAALPQGENL